MTETGLIKKRKSHNSYQMRKSNVDYPKRYHLPGNESNVKNRKMNRDYAHIKYKRSSDGYLHKCFLEFPGTRKMKRLL